MPRAWEASSSSETPPSGATLWPAHILCCQSGSSATSLAYALTNPRELMPKCTPDHPGEHVTDPVSLVCHPSEPPRRSTSAMTTSGRNHSHRPPAASVSLVSCLPAASVMKNTVAGVLSRRTIGLLGAGSTHSHRHSSPSTTKSFTPVDSLVHDDDSVLPSSGRPSIVGTSSPGSTSVLET